MRDACDLIEVSVDYWVDLLNNLHCQTSSINVNEFVEKLNNQQNTDTYAKDLEGTLPSGSAH